MYILPEVLHVINTYHLASSIGIQKKGKKIDRKYTRDLRMIVDIVNVLVVSNSETSIRHFLN